MSRADHGQADGVFQEPAAVGVERERSCEKRWCSVRMTSTSSLPRSTSPLSFKSAKSWRTWAAFAGRTMDSGVIGVRRMRSESAFASGSLCARAGRRVRRRFSPPPYVPPQAHRGVCAPPRRISGKRPGPPPTEPFAAGGTTGTLGRRIAHRLGATPGAKVVVDNKGGAGGQRGLGDRRSLRLAATRRCAATSARRPSTGASPACPGR